MLVVICPISLMPGMQVSNQVPASEPDTIEIGAKKLKIVARDRERSKFDDTIVKPHPPSG